MKHININPELVLQAIKILENSQETYPLARNTFLIYNNKLYPAKHVRWLVYKLAGQGKDRQDFAGGKETVRFFNRLGFAVQYRGYVYEPREYYEPLLKSSRLNRTEQKNALERLLQKHVGIIEVEKRFDWLTTPAKYNLLPEYEKIIKVLEDYRGFKDFYTPNRTLPCDYVIEEQKLIIEYDEQQHFTAPRRLTLELYPKEFDFYFPVQKWKQYCRIHDAHDNNPKDRDEARAFYDVVRDFEAFKNGYKLIRIKHGEFDWISPNAKDYLISLINTKPYKTLK